MAYMPPGYDPYTFDPRPAPIPRPSRVGIIAAWAFAILALVGTAVFLYLAEMGT